MKRFLIIFITLIVLLPLSTRLVEFGMSEKGIAAEFASAGISYTDHYYEAEGYQIHYVSVGDPSKPTVLFIHGSPGSWDTFIPFLTDKELADAFYLIAVDRPGHGMTAGEVLPNIEKETDVLLPLLSARNKPIIVAHSYGAPIATLLALFDQGNVASLIFLAPILDPVGEEKNYWKRISQVLAEVPLVRELVNPALLTAAGELKPLPEQIRAIEHALPNVMIPVTIMQGDRDYIGTVSNIDYVVSHFTGTVVEVVKIPGAGHRIPTHNEVLVREEIFKSLSAED